MLKENFIRRTAQFWDWFSENEETLSTIAMNPNPADSDRENTIKLVNEGVSLLAELHSVYINRIKEYE